MEQGAGSLGVGESTYPSGGIVTGRQLQVFWVRDRGRANYPGPAVKLTAEFDRYAGRDRDKPNHDSHHDGENHILTSFQLHRLGSPVLCAGLSLLKPRQLLGELSLRQSAAEDRFKLCSADSGKLSIFGSPLAGPLRSFEKAARIDST